MHTTTREDIDDISVGMYWTGYRVSWKCARVGVCSHPTDARGHCSALASTGQWQPLQRWQALRQPPKRHPHQPLRLHCHTRPFSSLRAQRQRQQR